MNYLLEMKAFYDRLELNPQPNTAIALWHALMYIANKAGWPDTFTVAQSVLTLKSGLSVSSLKRARNKLTTDGFIEWKSRGGSQSASYRIISLVGQYGPQSEPQPGPQSGPQSEPQSGPQSGPINKHKQELKKSNTDVLPEKPDSVSKQISTICELYNSICGSYPRLEKLSDARKRAIKARLNSGYVVDDFKRLFEMAERSDFLRGKNERNWSATFDWLIKDTNMAKVLDGNYENRSRGKTGEEKKTPSSKNRFDNFDGRSNDYEGMIWQQVRAKNAGGNQDGG